jgi:cbb3-type cytochrome oxidase subunit 3
MSDTTEVNTGAAGALVMIFLTIAFVILLVSFYRRYKRASKPENEQE